MFLKEYSLKSIEKRFKIENDLQIRNRLHIVLLLREGYTEREVASMLRMSNGIVHFWKKRFETKGYEGLSDKEGRGLKSSLSEEQLSMLASSIDMGLLMEDGYTRGFKTKDIVQFIKEEFDKEFTPRWCREIMKGIDCTLKVPRPRNKSRNQENVNAFKRKFKKKENSWVIT